MIKFDSPDELFQYMTKIMRRKLVVFGDNDPDRVIEDMGLLFDENPTSGVRIPISIEEIETTRSYFEYADTYYIQQQFEYFKKRRIIKNFRIILSIKIIQTPSEFYIESSRGFTNILYEDMNGYWYIFDILRCHSIIKLKPDQYPLNMYYLRMMDILMIRESSQFKLNCVVFKSETPFSIVLQTLIRFTNIQHIVYEYGRNLSLLENTMNSKPVSLMFDRDGHVSKYITTIGKEIVII